LETIRTRSEFARLVFRSRETPEKFEFNVEIALGGCVAIAHRANDEAASNNGVKPCHSIPLNAAANRTISRESLRQIVNQDASVVDWPPGVILDLMPQVATTGLLHGNTIELDTPVPPLEGRRVRVLLETAEPTDSVLSLDDQARLWSEWAVQGPQGPIDEGSEVEFP
jgi:hypothetical protein